MTPTFNRKSHFAASLLTQTGVCPCLIHPLRSVSTFGQVTSAQSVSTHPSSPSSPPLNIKTKSPLTLPRNIRIIRVLEEIKPPVAPRLQLLREVITLRARGDAAILLAPAIRRRTPLARAAIEQTDAAAWHGEVEVVLPEVAAGVGGLDYVDFAGGGAGGECESGMEVSIKVNVIFRCVDTCNEKR